MNLNNFKLRTKLISMISLTIVCLGLGTLYSMNRMANQFKEEIFNSYSFYSQVLGEKIAAQFYERYGDVQVFASDTSVQDLNREILPAHLDIFVEKYGIYDLILVVDRNGHFVAANTKDSTGKILNLRELSQMNFQSAPWFKAAIGGQFTDDKALGFAETVFEDPQYDPLFKVVTGESKVSLGFTTVIKGKKGEVVGVITNRSSTKWLDSETQAMYDTIVKSGDKSVNISVVNKEGLVLSEIFPDLNNGLKTPQYGEKRFLKANMKDDLGEATVAALARKSGSIEVMDKADGYDNIVGYSHIQNPKWPSSLGWNVLVHNSSKEVLENALASQRFFYVLFGAVTLLSLFFSVLLSLSISKTIAQLASVLAKNSTDVSDASLKIASSSTQLSDSASKQAAALQETVAAVDEISAMVDKNADSANRSKESSVQSREAAMKGREIVDNMIQAIGEINQSNDEVSQQMAESNAQLGEITKLINDIGSKTKVINEIVFQTKLLSFNASVEAARAGEYGKGFAVVAEEVGNLAQMSGNAAKEITSLLEESVQKVQTIVNDSKLRVDQLMTQSKEKVRAGSETAAECNKALEEILSNVSTVDTLVAEIAVASQEQATGIREIAKAVGQMEEVTQENSNVAESSSVAAEQLNAQSGELKAIVLDLVSLVEGSGATLAPASGSRVPKKPGQVIPFPQATPAAKDREPHRTFKKAAGAESMPSSDDPGFEE